MRRVLFLLMATVLVVGVYARSTTEQAAAAATQAGTGQIVIYQTPAEFQAKTGGALPAFKEAPELAALVSQGKLPAVADRVSKEPMVVQPPDAIGTYGGILRGAATGLTTEGWDLATIREQKLFSFLPDLSTLYTNIVKSAVFSDENKVLTVSLRDGMKWSDGQPVTADDYVFWYEDIFSNRDVLVNPYSEWMSGGQPVVVKKVDNLTVRFEFKVPNPTLPVNLAMTYGQRDPFAPAHFLKQYHIKYNPKAADMAKEAGFETWAQLFNDWFVREGGGQQAVHPETPVVNPWVWQNSDTSGNRFFVRNPYYWKVDTAGNQLPYINEMHRLVVQNTDAKKIATMNGEYDLSAKDLALGDYPLYKQNETKGNYTAILGTGTKGSYIVFGFNLTWPTDPVLTKIMSDVRFRQAMSLALNRPEINEVIFLGQGVPRQIGPVPGVSYYEDWMNDYYATYDVAKANQLLDAMGLKWDANKEYRLRPDGKTLAIPHEYWKWSPDVSKTVELTTEYWKAIGVKMDVKELEPSLYFTRRAGNDLAVVTWGGDNQTELRLYQSAEWSAPPWQVMIMTPWRDYYRSNGENGTKPPDQITELQQWNNRRLQVTLGSPEYMDLSKKIATRNLENLYQIGTVGLVPYPVIFKNTLANVPKSGVFMTDSNFFQPYVGETFYFK